MVETIDARADRANDLDGRIEISPISPVFGAEVSGIDLARIPDQSTVEQVERLIRAHKVLVFRDQFGVGPQELSNFATSFGRPETVFHSGHPDFPGIPAVKVIMADGSYAMRDTWHTDGSAREQTAWLSFLQAVDIPPYGRDTVFADMEAVFESLSPPLQQFLSGLTASHSWGFQKPDAPPISHPLAMEDKITGRRALYANRQFTRSIDGLDPAESDLLLNYLFSLVYVPEHNLRVVWRPGTVTVWDNQRTQHYIVQDSNYPRKMHRVIVTPAER